MNQQVITVPRGVPGPFWELHQHSLNLNLDNFRGNCDVPQLG